MRQVCFLLATVTVLCFSGSVTAEESTEADKKLKAAATTTKKTMKPVSDIEKYVSSDLLYRCCK